MLNNKKESKMNMFQRLEVNMKVMEHTGNEVRTLARDIGEVSGVDANTLFAFALTAITFLAVEGKIVLRREDT